MAFRAAAFGMPQFDTAAGAPVLRQDGLADAHELVGIFRRERHALPKPGFLPDQNVAAQIRHVELDTPGKSFPSAEHGRSDADFQNLVRGNDDGVEEKP